MKIDKNELKALIIRKGFTQESLAKKLGVTRKSLNNWILRESIPKKHQEALKEFLGEDLESMKNVPKGTFSPSDSIATQIEKMYQSKIEILKNTIEDKQKIIELLEARIKELER